MFRNPLHRYRVATAPAIVLLSIASIAGIAHASGSTSARPFETVAATTTAAPHATLLGGRAKLSSALAFATRPVRDRHIVVDALLAFAAALLAAALCFGSSAATRHARLRIDALFMRRRAPPYLLIVS